MTCEPVPNVVISSVKVARAHLMLGQFCLDGFGYECATLDDLNSDCAVLLSEWQGRFRPPEPDVRRLWNPCDPSSGLVPEWMTEAAIEWRRSKRRSY
ncbi:MAG: hypothetical protein EOS24_26060 [Mesorhizobium sp.]|uniref:hypothetical protein n=1 Tax=Mesorhizobium sp. TaxID=1871066 RepID=UPI000FE71FD9|nr:hypothetical protein [Mesorhizobium sp.]RWE53858.1 MAG: hypothetical protein EOS24_26060 [Mesorhizobium sp.]